MQELQRENKGGAVENTGGKSKMQKVQEKIFPHDKEKVPTLLILFPNKKAIIKVAIIPIKIDK